MATVGGDSLSVSRDLRRQLNQFLQGSITSGNISYETLSNSALYLLRTVPVARHAVLEHYALSFDEAINTHLSFADRNSWSGQDPEAIQQSQLSALQDVTGVLLSFIKSNAEAWAPVVSSWALSLLGLMSSKYAAKRGVQHVTSLNEVLQMWMACPPAKMLMEITTECFAAMVGSAPDICVDALLEASVRYSPHFDWVVAHIGSCFPRTIITRVLNCGLKDYCTGSVDGSDKDASSSRMKVPKMASVVGILGHLAAKHSQDIRKALMALFEASLHSDTQSSRVTTLPFLLQLASMSDLLLNILTPDLVSVLSSSVVNQLHRQFTHWKRSSPSDYNSFLNLVVHLIAKCKVGSCDIINFLLRTALPQEESAGSELPVDEVRDTCIEIMHILLFELQRGVLARKGNAVVVDLPLLSGLAEQSSKLTTLLLQSYGKRVPWLQKLLTYTSLQAGENCSASMLANIVFSANTPQQLGTFYKLRQGSELGIPSVISSTLVHIFNKLTSATTSQPESTANSSNVLRALRNLEKLVNVEKVKIKRKALTCSTILEGLKQRHSVLCDLLLSANEDISMCALRLMTLVGFPDDLSISLLTRLCSVIAIIFFTSLHKNTEQKDDASKADRMTQLCMSCIEQLSRYPFTKSLFIHYLLEGAVQKENCHLFGGRWQPATSNSPHGNGVDTVSLLEENRQQSLSIALPRFHSSVYHGGIIRQIPKTQLPVKPLQKSQVVRNCLIFTETLWLCCRENRQRCRQDLSGQVNSDTGHEPMETDQVNRHMTTISESSARTLGCVIVDILTLDTLYNDVHWQDPDFRKVTTERDTLVWKRLEDLPVVWNVIQEFSSSCVFVYYLSPVLRSLMAVIMNHLEVSRDTRMRNCPKQFEGAIKLVHCLTKGSMIPPPLSNVAELFPFVSPYEGYLLLLTLWRYIKENPPTEFEKEQSSRTCDTSHMFVVHSILHANINHMGHLCPRFFNM
ncbi:integrator complex subunit 5-like [Biomphalaria glabrata]|uniref:Integrator complex subunit 5-like n=1 Tax=Biomphalaria glabrata TaxID=6526 RepID=A0A9W3BG44_BIOGL|nr:integrator complex subunit 5-like [Biomphalaria glabrata]